MSKHTTSTIRVEISPKTIFMIIGVIIGMLLLYKIRNIVMMIFIAIIIASAASGPITKLQNRNLPRWLSVAVVYVMALSITLLILSIVSVPLARQSINFAAGLPNMFAQLADFLNRIGYSLGIESEILETDYIKQALEQTYRYFSDNIGDVVSAGTQGLAGVFQILINIFGGLFAFVSILTIAIYISYDHDALIDILTGSIHDKDFRRRVSKLLKDIEEKLGSWMRGQLTVATISGMLTWLALSLLQIPYALPLALFTAILVNIPVFGATLSLVPALLVALATGNLFQVIGVTIAYIVIQQVENNVVAPKVMSNAIGIRPLVVILAILIGAELAGVIGVLVAVPLAGMLQLAWDFHGNNGEDIKTN
jgi:predicted PurR-regulated permease PerM